MNVAGESSENSGGSSAAALPTGSGLLVEFSVLETCVSARTRVCMCVCGGVGLPFDAYANLGVLPQPAEAHQTGHNPAQREGGRREGGCVARASARRVEH